MIEAWTKRDLHRWLRIERSRRPRLRTDEVPDAEVLRAIRECPPHYAGVSFHASSTGTAHNPTSGGTVTITKPSVSAGDILVCEFGENNATTADTITAPAGWTRIGLTITSTKVRTDVWWSLQSNTNLGFTHNGDGVGTSDLSWTCSSFANVDNTTPIDATGTGNTNTGANSISAATFNTVTDGALELIAITNWNGGAVFTSTGFTVVPSSLANCQTALLYANAVVTPAGATGAKTVNDSAAASGNILCYQQFALRPAVVVAGVTYPQLESSGRGYFRGMG